jgi:hypothetical protein
MKIRNFAHLEARWRCEYFDASDFADMKCNSRKESKYSITIEEVRNLIVGILRRMLGCAAVTVGGRSRTARSFSQQKAEEHVPCPVNHGVDAAIPLGPYQWQSNHV